MRLSNTDRAECRVFAPILRRLIRAAGKVSLFYTETENAGDGVWSTPGEVYPFPSPAFYADERILQRRGSPMRNRCSIPAANAATARVDRELRMKRKKEEEALRAVRAEEKRAEDGPAR